MDKCGEVSFPVLSWAPTQRRQRMAANLPVTERSGRPWTRPEPVGGTKKTIPSGYGPIENGHRTW